MNHFLTIITSDYLQRVRNYSFLVTLCATLAIAYTFVPEPNSNYSTIRISDYVGHYNSAWFGYVTAIMTSIFLSLIGFYLVSSSVQKDIHTHIGSIIASTKISNFKYLFSKAITNFIILFTIMFFVFTMSIILFFLYNDGSSFEIFQFIKPYFFITLPALFFTAFLAVVFEVVFHRYSIIQNIIYFFLFFFLAILSPKNEAYFSFDVFGSKIVTHHLEKKIREITNSDENNGLTIGYVMWNLEKTKRFDFNGIHFPVVFIFSRLIWMVFGLGLLGIASLFFHRFRSRQPISRKEKAPALIVKNKSNIVLFKLPKSVINYSILPLLKTELLLIIRTGHKRLWYINIVGMLLLVLLPLEISHQIVLPVLWFLQVGKLSGITTKEKSNSVHYFAFTSYKPLRRLLFSQILAGCLLLWFLALPLLIRYLFQTHLESFYFVVLGSIFVVLLASVLGILFKGKKLFEVLFFIVTYAIINGILFFDYLGSFKHNNSYSIKLLSSCILLIVLSSIVRVFQIKKG